MADRSGDGLFGSDLWQAALEKFAGATHLTVKLFDVHERAAFGPVHATPLFQLFDETGYDPGIFAECARRCIAQTATRPAVIVSQFHGLAVVGASLALEGRIVGAAVGGYAFADFSQVFEIQRLAGEAGIAFDRLWVIARVQPPVPRARLTVHGELLQVLGDALLREQYRARQYEQAAAIVDSSGDAIISKDLDSRITSWNRGAERLFGYTAQEAIGQPITLLMPPDRLDEEPRIMERVRRGEKIDHFETVRRCKDGTLLDISLNVSPLIDVQGRIVGASKIARDITERKREQHHRELLINELNHRVKNTLAMVQSFAMQTFRHAATSAEGLELFEARLFALSKAHDVLTQTQWQGASVSDVTADSTEPYSGDEKKSRFQITGPYVHLSSKTVLALSMALHELVTNSVKYGALSNDTGIVAISWQLVPGVPQRFQWRWEERGGPPVETPSRRGFGSRLIEDALARDLGEARLTFARGGVVCTIDAPLDEVVGNLPRRPRELSGVASGE